MIVHYKGVNSSEDFIVIAESPEIVQKWRGDKSIAMTEVVNSYQIFITGGHGNQGTLETPAKGTLENEFGTSNVDDVIKQILEKGNVLETLVYRT